MELLFYWEVVMDVKQRVVVGFIVVVLFGGVIAWIYKISTYKPPLPEVYISSLPDTEVAFKTSDKEVFAEEEEKLSTPAPSCPSKGA